MTNKLRIRLKAYDSRILDNSIEKIINVLEPLGANIKGPIPLPTEKRVYTILRSVHKHKDSREQFEQRIHNRLIDINNPSKLIIEQLKAINLPSTVKIEIKA